MAIGTIVAMTTTIRLRGPADIIAILPYHLGYRPSDSLVLVLLDGPRVVLVARVDLPPDHVDPALVVDELMPPVLREQPDRAVIVGFETRPGHAEPTSTAMRDALLDAGIGDLERLVVRGGRWWCLDGNGCGCRPEGEPVPSDDRVPAVSDYVVLGRLPAPSRASLADRLRYAEDPVQDARCAALIHELESVRRAPRPLHRRRRRMLEAWGRILGPGGPLEEDWAWAVVGLLDITVRDLLIAWLCPGTLDPAVFPVALRRVADACLPAPVRPPVERGRSGQPGVALAEVDAGAARRTGSVQGEGDEHDELAELRDLAGLDGSVAAGELVERLAAVCRRSPPEISPGPLTVLGHVAWWQGDGAMARTAVDAALAVDAGYRLAVLLATMVDVAARPPRTA